MNIGRIPRFWKVYMIFVAVIVIGFFGFVMWHDATSIWEPLEGAEVLQIKRSPRSFSYWQVTIYQPDIGTWIVTHRGPRDEFAVGDIITIWRNQRVAIRLKEP